MEIDFNEQWWLGKSYVLKNYKMPLSKYLEFYFHRKRIRIDIFDPNFYLYTDKDLTIPKYRIVIQPGECAAINLQAKYVEMMNRPEQPCEDSGVYSFTDCVEVGSKFTSIRYRHVNTLYVIFIYILHIFRTT